MDYANQRRLKIFATVEVIDADSAPDMIETLRMPGYKAKMERAMILHVKAFDWNCPQHITPRFTLDEINEMSASIYESIARLEAENHLLKQKLKAMAS